ncbi:hypothetical protein [Streptomyces phaeochromogenes]|uniref:hypothetical protein n=1 Tax=Streptomyces phaeochromogenes TaxID=1923 RepID=UPI0038637F2C|nr:hypothetical protein OHB08_01190 [Streptomyces phaeochromogenes]
MAQTLTGLFPVTDPDLQAKGRQKMHGLALYVSHVWEACASTDTKLCRDHGLVVDSERVALEIAPALAAVRTLDLEVFRAGLHGADDQRYLARQKTDPQGQVVLGLVLARNADIHLPAALDLHVDRVVGDGDGYRVMPSWLAYDRLPAVVRASKRSPGSKNGTSEVSHDAYRDSVGGHLVIETLLDAFAFFRRCDPALARCVPQTEDLTYFPLSATNTGHGYERRHPDQPNWADFGAEVRRLTEDVPPSGAGREVSYRLDSEGKAVYCGHTVERFGLRSAFTESAAQIARDVRAGYLYVAVAADGVHHPVTVGADSCLWADSVALESFPFPQPHRHPLPQTWLAWWQFVLDDPFWYRRQRLGH